MTESHIDSHRNHVGIGITRKSYNTFRKVAKKNRISMRELLDRLARIADLDTLIAVND